jgi:predicted DNA-binding protein
VSAFFSGEKMQNAQQKNIRLPIEMMERLRKYIAASGYTITQVWLAALDDYLTARGY